ncbi:hypothetical protein BsWGS_03113 [Bradybaena similaris]
MSQEACASQASSSSSQGELSAAGDLGVLGQNSKLPDHKPLTEAQAPPVGDLHCSDCPAMRPAAETVEEIPEKTFDDLFIELRDRVPCLRGDDSASRVYILKHIISYIDNLRAENFVLSHNEGEWEEECGDEWEEREWEEGGYYEEQVGWEEGYYEEQEEAGWEEEEWEEHGEPGYEEGEWGEEGWEGGEGEWEEQGPEREEQGPELEEQGPEWEVHLVVKGATEEGG